MLVFLAVVGDPAQQVGQSLARDGRSWDDGHVLFWVFVLPVEFGVDFHFVEFGENGDELFFEEALGVLWDLISVLLLA